MDKENVVRLHNGVLLGGIKKKQWHLEICMQMDWTRKKKHPEWCNPDPQGWAWS